MGIFSRVKDIVNSNLNSLLDKAEDPEKLLKMIIREMEDTLVDLKASCAGAMAARKKAVRDEERSREKAEDWAAKAKLAVEKGREDLAREALLEKRSWTERADGLANEVAQHEDIVHQYKSDIVAVEDKLEMARDKLRILVQRHIRAQRKHKAQSEIRRVNAQDALMRFEAFENRVERIEAEADLVNYKRNNSLEEEFDKLRTDEALEAELADLKNQMQNKG